MKYLGDLEQAISEKMSDFSETEMGLRPIAVRTAIQGDLIIIRFENALSTESGPDLKNLDTEHQPGVK